MYGLRWNQHFRRQGNLSPRDEGDDALLFQPPVSRRDVYFRGVALQGHGVTRVGAFPLREKRLLFRVRLVERRARRA